MAALYRLGQEPLVAGLALAALVAWGLWPFVQHAVLFMWVGAKAAVAALRLLDTAWYYRRHHRKRSARKHLPWFLLLLLADGLVWGAAGVVLHPAGLPEIGVLVLACMVGAVGATSIFPLGSFFVANALFASALMLPSVAVQALRQSPEGWLGVGGLTLFYALVLLQAHRVQHDVKDTLSLRLQSQKVARERKRALAMSEDANAAKTRFLATISHEVRTPLNGILGMTQVLQRSPLSAQQQAQLGIVQRSGRHLLTVINDILDLTKAEAGKLSITPQVFSLPEALSDVTDLHHATANDKGLRFVVSIHPRVTPWALGDAPRIKQVLHNLIGNAIKFTAKGSVRVSVDWDALVQPPLLLVQVHDSGEGLRTHQLESIFEPFHQASEGAELRRSGTGLGLTISRQLARAMGGDITCQSRLGKGSAFTFTCALPAAVAPPVLEADAQRLLPRLRGRVLVVDDNAVNVMVASAMLEALGLGVASAEDGEAALQRMQHEAFVLVLLDCQMPVLDGLQVAQRWRLLERLRPGRLPIVALTANAMQGDHEKCLAAGMDEVLTKPLDLDHLSHVMQQFLLRHGPGQALAATAVPTASVVLTGAG